MNTRYKNPTVRANTMRKLSVCLPALLLASHLLTFSASAQFAGGFVWADQQTAASYVPSTLYSYNSTTDILDNGVTITRSGTGIYNVEWAGLENTGANGGHVQVTAYDASSAYCGVGSWGANGTSIFCFDNSGNSADTEFAAWFLKPDFDTPGIAYAWANDASSASYTPDAFYSYNAGGGDITITRSSVGQYNVAFGGYESVGINGGNVQVSSYGGTNSTCKVVSWGSGNVDVRCYDTGGNPVDAVYTVLFLKPDATTGNLSFAWADDPVAAAAYEPSLSYSFNSGNSTITATHTGTGTYSVLFDGYSAIGFNGGNVLVSAYNQDSERCKVSSWGSQTVYVACFDIAGNPVDSYFTVTYWRPEKPNVPEELNGISFAWGNSPTSDLYTPDFLYLLNASGLNATASRSGAGNYRIEFDGLTSGGINDGTVQVSAYAGATNDCEVNNWGASTVDISCFDQLGSAVDALYSVLYISPTEETNGLAYSWANDMTAAEYIPSAGYTYNAGGGDVTITRGAVGSYSVEFAGFAEQGDNGGHVQVSSYGSAGERCNTAGWGSEVVSVVCFDAAGTPVDSRFAVLFLKPKFGSEGMAYAWADESASATYTPSTLYSYNSAGGAITASRSAVGTYSILFADYNTVGVKGGNVQVSAYGSTGARCSIANWSSSIVNVLCVDSGGNPADSQYDVMYLKPTENTGTDVQDELENTELSVLANYPNPFSGETSITYSLDAPTQVTLTVYDVRGRLVSTIVDGIQSAGDQVVTFNADGLASGVYFYSLRTEKSIKTGKMMLRH